MIYYDYSGLNWSKVNGHLTQSNLNLYLIITYYITYIYTTTTKIIFLSNGVQNLASSAPVHKFNIAFNQNLAFRTGAFEYKVYFNCEQWQACIVYDFAWNFV